MKHNAERALGLMHRVTVVAVMTVLTVKAFFELSQHWDFLNYHLPAALRMFGLTTFRETAYLGMINQSFPPLPHFFQGLFVKLGGRISFANGLNAAALLALTFFLSRMFRDRFSAPWFLTGCLAVPLVVTQYCSGYIDLTVGAAVTFAFAALLMFEFELGRSDADTALRRSFGWIASGFAAAMLSKYQAWPFIVLFYLCLVLRLAALVREQRLAVRRAVIVVISLAGFVAVWPVRNIVVFDNPIHPYPVPGASTFFADEFSVGRRNLTDIPPSMKPRSRPLRFAHSVFEINRLGANGEFRWTHDQHHYPGGVNDHSRMGGWFFATMFVFVAALITLLRAGAIPRFWTAVFLGAIVLASFLPESHQLRYTLFIPISLSAMFAVGSSALRGRRRAAIQCALLGCAAYVLAHTVSWTIDLSLPEDLAPPDARAYWAESAETPGVPTLVCGQAPRTIYWAGPTFNEYSVEACYSK